MYTIRARIANAIKMHITATRNGGIILLKLVPRKMVATHPATRIALALETSFSGSAPGHPLSPLADRTASTVCA
jgi:hypothetical protein